MDDVKKLLGKRIKELRIAKKLSQQELAERINIDQRSLSYIECGKAFPSKCILELADALNVEIGELFSFSHLKLNTSQMKEFIKKRIDTISDNDVRIIYRFLLAMK